MTESTVTREEKEAIAEAVSEAIVSQHPDDELSDWDEGKPTLAERVWWKVYDTITFSLRSVLALVVVAVLLGAAFPGLSDVSQTAREGIIIMYKFAVGL